MEFKRARIYAAGAALAGLAAFATAAGPVSAQASGLSTVHGARSAATAGARLTETSTASRAGDAINTLAITRYPGAFAGVRVNNAATVTVYLKTEAPRLLAAIAAVPHPGVTLRIDRVARSYQQLENLTSRLARNVRELAATGVNLQSWAPDPATDTVKITLVTPAHATREALARQASTARSTLDRAYGAAWVTIAGQTQARSAAAQRDNDSAPYYAGDGLYYSALGVDCTSGWSTTGKKTGDSFILSAGHCGWGSVYLEYGSGDNIGSVSSQYLDALSNDQRDFETIRASGAGYVWNGAANSDTDYSVVNSITPAGGSLMAFDGDVTKQVTDNTVGMVNGCTSVTDPYYGSYTVCDAGEAADSTSGPKICQDGDSGGPAYVRQPNGTSVAAAGTIVSTADNGHQCYFQEMASELSTANLNLDKTG
jgi:hypothetical protein